MVFAMLTQVMDWSSLSTFFMRTSEFLFELDLLADRQQLNFTRGSIFFQFYLYNAESQQKVSQGTLHIDEV